ncbi:metallophosphoesterase, partial [Olsenella sp. An290]|uniref:metallophosphoesterase family protein n=1 Tax=Olsenella sp. An290 TaxID=1965625 RepID=UPI000B551850
SGDYWFTYNGVLFMSLNSNDMNTSEHKAFMKEAIAANPDANWKIVTFHHSVYSVASHTADGDILQRRSELPAVFSELDIDAVLMGHDHVYTRTYLMDGTTPLITDEVQSEITDPEDGQVLYITANSASGSKYYDIQNLPQNTFAAVQDQSKRENMTRVEVTEDSLTFTTYFTDDAQVTSDDVLDTVTIQRTDAGEQNPGGEQGGSQVPGGEQGGSQVPGGEQGGSQVPSDGLNPGGNQGSTVADGTTKPAGSTMGQGTLPQTGDALVAPATITTMAAAGLAAVAVRKTIIMRRKNN